LKTTFVVVSYPEDEVRVTDKSDRNSIGILSSELEFEESAEVGQIYDVILIIEDSCTSAINNGYFDTVGSVSIEKGAPVGIIKDNFTFDAPPFLLELGGNLDISEEMVSRLTVAHLLG